MLFALFVVFTLMLKARTLNQYQQHLAFAPRFFVSLVLLAAVAGLLFAVESGQSLQGAQPSSRS
jgi:hypothetical protein